MAGMARKALQLLGQQARVPVSRAPMFKGLSCSTTSASTLGHRSLVSSAHQLGFAKGSATKLASVFSSDTPALSARPMWFSMQPRRFGGMVDVSESRPDVIITDRCAQRVLKVNPDGFLRISVDGGGCSGFQYKFELVDAKEEDDVEFLKDGAKIVVDETSMDFLRGSTLDFVEEMISSSFQVVNNPNSESSCGCGTSFAPKI